MNSYPIHKLVLRHLEKDSVIKSLIKKYSIPKLSAGNSDIFLDLIETIINQQLSSRAADAILGRFKNIFKDKQIIAEKVINISDSNLRRIGLSFQKIKYIKGLCEKLINKELDLQSLYDMSDKEVIEKLTSIKGIGPWSAEMTLIFSLNRPDIFALGDLGLCTAVSRLYNVDRKDKKKIEIISKKWSPYRSYACLYLWRSLENK